MNMTDKITWDNRQPLSANGSFCQEEVAQGQTYAQMTHQISSARDATTDILCAAFSGDLLAVGYAGREIRLFSLENAVRSNDKSNGDVHPSYDRRITEVSQSPLCAHTYAINALVFSESGVHLVSASQDGRAALWDTRTGRVLCEFRHESGQSLRDCALSPCGEFLLTGSDDETAVMWSMKTMSFVRSFAGHESSVTASTFTPDSRLAITGDGNGNVNIWLAVSAKASLRQAKSLTSSPPSAPHPVITQSLHTIDEAHDLGVTCAQCAPYFTRHTDSRTAGGSSNGGATSVKYTLATGGIDDTVKIWSIIAPCTTAPNMTVKARLEHTLTEQRNNLMCLTYSKDGNLLATGAGDRTVVVWETRSYTKLTCIDHHKRYVTCVAFSQDASLLATGSNDKTLAVWHLSHDEEVADLQNIKLTDSPLMMRPSDPKTPLRHSPSFKHPASRQPSAAIVDAVKNVADWSIDDVVNWLSHMGMGEHETRFREKSVDGQQLVIVSEAMLKNGIGVEPASSRSKLLSAINELRNEHTYAASVRHTTTMADELLCPITREPMNDPVVAADGYSYERSALLSWIDAGKRSSPMTNMPLAHLDMTPNRVLKMIIHHKTHIQ